MFICIWLYRIALFHVHCTTIHVIMHFIAILPHLSLSCGTSFSATFYLHFWLDANFTTFDFQFSIVLGCKTCDFHRHPYAKWQKYTCTHTHACMHSPIPNTHTKKHGTLPSLARRTWLQNKIVEQDTYSRKNKKLTYSKIHAKRALGQTICHVNVIGLDESRLHAHTSNN